MSVKTKILSAVLALAIVAVAIVALSWVKIRKQAPYKKSQNSKEMEGISRTGPAVFKIGETKIVKTQDIGTEGGDIAIEKSGTPLDGMKINFEQGAVPRTRRVSVGYNNGHFESLAEGYPTGVTVAIKVENAAGNLEKPMTITFDSDKDLVIGYAIDSDGKLHGVDTFRKDDNRFAKSYTFVPDTMITWIYLNND